MGQQLSFKCKHRGVVPVHGPWSRKSKTSHLKLKREVSRTGKRFKIAIMFSGRRRRSREERNGFFPLPRLQFMLGLHFTPARVLLLVCSLHFTPGPQSAFYTDRIFNPDAKVTQHLTCFESCTEHP